MKNFIKHTKHNYANNKEIIKIANTLEIIMEQGLLNIKLNKKDKGPNLDVEIKPFGKFKI